MYQLRSPDMQINNVKRTVKQLALVANRKRDEKKNKSNKKRKGNKVKMKKLELIIPLKLSPFTVSPHFIIMLFSHA